MLLWGVGGTLLSLVLNNHVGNPGTGGFTLLAVNRNSTIFPSPLLIQIPANGVIPFYSQNCPAAGLYSATGNANLELVGKDPVFSIYTTVFVETKQVNLKTRRFGNFGYYLNTNAMDQPGKDFIVNFSYYVGQLKL